MLWLGAALTGCESGPEIRQTRVRVSEVEMRTVPAGTLFESVMTAPARQDPMSNSSGTRTASLRRDSRVLRSDTMLRVLYRGSYRALVLIQGGERGYVPVAALQARLPDSALANLVNPQSTSLAGTTRSKNRPVSRMETFTLDPKLDVFVDQSLIDEVNRGGN